MPSHRLWVGNITYTATQDDLEAEFLKFGKISNVTFREGFAFIDFEDAADAEKAKEELQGRQFQGRGLQVDWARSEGQRPRHEPRDPAPSPSGGGSRHLYVARIPEAVSADELTEFFAQHGNVQAVKMLPQKGSYRSAFVDFERADDAAEAYASTETLHGVALRLDYNHRTARARGGPGGADAERGAAPSERERYGRPAERDDRHDRYDRYERHDRYEPPPEHRSERYDRYDRYERYERAERPPARYEPHRSDRYDSRYDGRYERPAPSPRERERAYYAHDDRGAHGGYARGGAPPPERDGYAGGYAHPAREPAGYDERRLPPPGGYAERGAGGYAPPPERAPPPHGYAERRAPGGAYPPPHAPYHDSRAEPPYAQHPPPPHGGAEYDRYGPHPHAPRDERRASAEYAPPPRGGGYDRGGAPPYAPTPADGYGAPPHGPPPPAEHYHHDGARYAPPPARGRSREDEGAYSPPRRGGDWGPPPPVEGGGGYGRAGGGGYHR